MPEQPEQQQGLPSDGSRFPKSGQSQAMAATQLRGLQLLLLFFLFIKCWLSFGFHTRRKWVYCHSRWQGCVGTQRSLSEGGAWLWWEPGIAPALAHGDGAVRMWLSPSPGTPSCLSGVGKTSQRGNETLWESNVQSQIPALLVPAQGLGLAVSATVPGLQGRGLRPGTLLRVGDRAWGHPAAPWGRAAPSIPGAAGFSPPALTNPSPCVPGLCVRTRGEARTSGDLRGEPFQDPLRFCPGTSVAPRVVEKAAVEKAPATSVLFPATAGTSGRLELGAPRAGRGRRCPRSSGRSPQLPAWHLGNIH